MSRDSVITLRPQLLCSSMTVYQGTVVLTSYGVFEQDTETLTSATGALRDTVGWLKWKLHMRMHWVYETYSFPNWHFCVSVLGITLPPVDLLTSNSARGH